MKAETGRSPRHTWESAFVGSLEPVDQPRTGIRAVANNADTATHAEKGNGERALEIRHRAASRSPKLAGGQAGSEGELLKMSRKAENPL